MEAKYRKVYPHIWNDAKFMRLTTYGKFVFLFLLTHPNMTSIGAMRANVPGMACDLGWDAKAFREAFGEVLREGMARHDEKASFVCLPNFLKYNQPESPNVVKSWVRSFPMIPECGMKNQLFREILGLSKGYGEAFREAFVKAFGKAMPNQEPEQEQEQEQEKGVQGANDASAPPPAHTVSEKKPKAEDKNAARVYDHYLHNVQTTHASNREQTIRNISSLITRLQKEDIGDGKTREDLATYLCQTIDRYLRSAAYQTDPQFHYKASNFFGRRGEWSAFAQDDSPAMMPREDEDARRRREIREEIAKRRDACFADYEARGIDCRTITLVDVPKGANCDGCRRQIMALDEQAKRAETREQTVLETEAAV